jgi:hypothetical protein
MPGIRANRRIVQAAAIVAVLAAALPATAQDPSTRPHSQATDASLRAGRDLFHKGSVGIEIGASPMVEIWNINEEHEQVIEGTAAFWGAIANRIAVGIEFHHAFVIQDAPGAFVQGLSPMVRFKLTNRPRWNWYAETGPGVSWADLPTPVRGTKFNYLFQARTGLMRRVGSNGHALIAYRFFHLSNNERAGKDHNPDLEMMGAYVGWGLSF